MAQEKIDLKPLDVPALNSEISKLKAEMQRASFEKVIRGVQDTSQFGKTRKEIARIKTELRARQLAEFTPEQLELRSKLRTRRARVKKKK